MDGIRYQSQRKEVKKEKIKETKGSWRKGREKEGRLRRSEGGEGVLERGKEGWRKFLTEREVATKKGMVSNKNSVWKRGRKGR